MERKEFCGMLKKLDDSLPLAESSELSAPDLAGRFFLACRGVSDYLMTLLRGALAEALARGSERMELSDLLLALGDPAWCSGTVQTLTSRAVYLLRRCGVELIVLDEFHHLFDLERARVMTKTAQWLKVLIVNTGIPIVVCGMPEAEHVLRAEHTERRFKERITLRSPEAPKRAPQAGSLELCGEWWHRSSSATASRKRGWITSS
jgi:hypothetical protein